MQLQLVGFETLHSACENRAANECDGLFPLTAAALLHDLADRAEEFSHAGHGSTGKCPAHLVHNSSDQQGHVGTAPPRA